MYVGIMGAGGGIGPGPRPGESSRVAVPGLLGASREGVARHGDPGSSEILPSCYNMYKTTGPEVRVIQVRDGLKKLARVLCHPESICYSTLAGPIRKCECGRSAMQSAEASARPFCNKTNKLL